MAAMLLLCIGGVSGWVVRGTLQAAPGGLVALAQEATASYNVYAPDQVRTVEVRASDSAQLVQWVSDRLRRPVKVPDLANSGYRLMGGRLVATQHGPAAMFMYDDDHGSRLVVLTRPMSTADENAPMTRQSHGDVGGFAWADDGVGYSLMGHAAPESLRPIANEVRKAGASDLNVGFAVITRVSRFGEHQQPVESLQAAIDVNSFHLKSGDFAFLAAARGKRGGRMQRGSDMLPA
jgi:anti-sigma factor RsiW